MKRILLLLLTSFMTFPLWADVSEGSAMVRNGRNADALDALRGDTTPEAAFWRGRALINLGRLKEAAAALHQVPTEHELFPYAAKALLYCAWKDSGIDFAVTATPMATCNNPEIATLATAALAEYWLHKPKSQDNTALERLRRMAEEKPEYKNLLSILEIDNLRLKGEFDKAIELCRNLETSKDLPLIMRQRVRLALADVYYSKEKAEKATTRQETEPQQGLSFLHANTNQDAVVYDDGKGEETLLHFISSHPDSPLLEEAFQRLYERKAFSNSEFARLKLKEWMAEPLKSRRAAIALLIQQHQMTPERAYDVPLDVTCANTAAATCPNEPATRTLLLEQTRWFLERNQMHEALLYLGMIQGDDVFKTFYENQMHTPEHPGTAQTYLDCARHAPESLRNTAIINALICALKSGDTITEEAVLNMQDLSEEQHYNLLLTRAGYWLDKDTAKAQKDIDLLMTHPAPSPDLQADVEMDHIYLQMQNSPHSAYELLLKSKINDNLTKLSPERQLRFFALQEEALKRISQTSDEVDAAKEALNLVKQAAGRVHHPKVVSILTLHMASIQSTLGLHTDAMHTLNVLIRKYPKGDFAARAQYMSAREAEFISTQDSLKHACDLYATCAERSEELATKANIRRAAVLLRLGQHEESEHVLVALMRNKKALMREEDKVLAYAVLANNKALLGTDEGLNEAIRIVGQSLDTPGLPRWWQYRVLLHHATLCSRAGQYEQALNDYNTVLSMKPATGELPTKADWHILYSAGSGAVMQLLYLERFSEAADKADEIAAWNIEKSDLSKRKQFSNWAQYIRQTNFVDKNSLPF